MKKWLWVLFVLSIGVTMYADMASAEVKADYGGAFRLRQEYWENTIDLQTPTTPTHSDRDFFRLRTSLWGKVDVNQDLGAYLKLTNEAKYYIGSYKPVFEAGKTGDNFDADELIVDNLFVDYKNVFGIPLDLRIGRQDFIGPTGYGEGFLIMDGTPVDGSRTFYFNAVKATVKIDKNNSVDLVYTSNTKTDQYLPSLYPARPDGASYSGNKRVMNASNEDGAWLYIRSKLNDNLSVEPYYIYKKEEPIGAIAALKMNAVGARAVFTAAGWRIRGEFAHQFGKYDDTATVPGKDRKAYGGYIFGGQKYDTVALKPEWELGYVYLSGDDLNSTDKHEGWDPLFSRAPAWNELYIYTMINESAGKEGFAAPGYWTNMHLYKFGVKLTLDSATGLALSYQLLRADQNTALSTTMYSNISKDRGQLGTLMLTHAFSKQVSAYLQAEYFVPGSFYSDRAQNAAFLRWQLQYTF